MLAAKAATSKRTYGWIPGAVIGAAL